MSRDPFWLARLTISLWVGSSALIALMRPDSLMAKTVLPSGALGGVALWGLVAVSLIGLLDNLMNDLLPRCSLRLAMRHRHTGFMAMSIALVLCAGVVAKHEGLSPLLLNYMLPAALAVWVSFLDVFARYKQ